MLLVKRLGQVLEVLPPEVRGGGVLRQAVEIR